MSFIELLGEAFSAIRAHALRSILTLLGIIIGVSTIVGVVSVIAGLNGYVQEKVIVLSPDVWVLTKFGIIRGRDEFLLALKRKDIDWHEYERLSQLLTETSAIAAQVTSSAAVKHGDRRLADIQVVGTTANYPQLFNIDLAAGRYFLEAEARASQGLAIIGWDVKDELFPHVDPIGREITVDGRPARVIGLVAQQGRTLGQSQDNRVYVPIQLHRQWFGRRQSLDLLLRARGGVPGIDRSIDETRTVLRALRHTSYKAIDPFGVVTNQALQTLWTQISGAAFLMMFLISAVSLGVGGVVIMNIMFVSVVERTAEIGVRRAVGAQDRDIRRQFVLEAALLSFTGGLMGAGAGGALALFVRHGLDFPVILSPAIMLLGLGLSVVVGLAAGYWPARQASRLNIIDSLRAE
jgi:putative ABC transport system permease protein